MNCFLVVFTSDLKQEVINKLGDHAMVFTLNNYYTSNFLEYFNTPANSSQNFNF